MMGLYQKINAVMKDVEYLSKDDSIQFGNTKYKAISEEKVTSTVRESLVKHGLIILPIEQEHFREDTILKDKDGKESLSRLTTVNVKYKIIDMETGEHEIIASSGTGVDTQDKGVGKAMTYAYKYALLRSFSIPTGEDPDKISSEELDSNQGKEVQKQGLNQGKLSDKQVNRAIAIGKSKNISLEQIKKTITKDYGKTDIADLTKEQYEELCNRMEKVGA